MRTAPFSQLEPLVGAIVPVLLPHLSKPFAFFGHSMGAVDNFQQQVESNHESKRQFSSYHRKRHYRLCPVGKGRSQEALIWVEYAYVQGTLPLRKGLRIYEFSQPATSETNRHIRK